MTHFMLGDYHCDVLRSGQFLMNAATLFANAPAETLSAVLAKHHLAADSIVFQVNPLVVDTGQHRVLLDPGTSDDPKRLINALKAATIDPASINAVIISHGHADHYNGCVDADGSPAFPQARYFIQRAEWDAWMDGPNPEPHHAATFRQRLLPIQHCFSFLEGEGEIVPGIEAISTPGHSAGHMAILIGGRMIYVGDVILNVVYIEHPDWYAAFDVMPAAVVQTRQNLIQYIIRHNLLVSTFHFAAPGTGRIVADGHTWQWVPEVLS